MTKTQRRLLLALFGLFLLSPTYFREEQLVAAGAGGIWAYRLLVISGLLLLAGGTARLLSRKVLYWSLSGLVLFEVFVALLFQLTVNGWQFPQPVVKTLSYIYHFRCTDYIVYDRERGRWDKELFYTLRPGEFQYENMEFSNRYHVNSMGWRDDEASLHHPEMVFLGDSYTMGWGVEQDESYAALLEKILGLRALNTGIASYGTAREYLTFRRVQMDSCRLLVLQFCPNDVAENRSFVQAGFHLNASPEDVFKKEISWNNLHRHYFPLKYLHATLHFFVKKWKSSPASPGTCQPAPDGGICQEEVADFFKTLQKIRECYNGPIVVFSLGMGITKPAVTRQFGEWLDANPMPDIHLFSVAEHLPETGYLPLDKHLTAEGNRKLAEGLAKFIQEHGLGGR